MPGLHCQIPMTEPLPGRGRQGSTVTSLVTVATASSSTRATAAGVRKRRPHGYGSEMNDLLFGLFLNPSRARSTSILANGRVAEQAGFDYTSVQDHPYVSEFLDPLVLIGALTAQTERIRFMTNVSNLPLRPPAMPAKAAASLDVLSGVRFRTGRGAGTSRSRVALAR